MQGVENTEDALSSIIKSIKKEMKDDIVKVQFEASIASISNETSSSNEEDKDDNNTSITTSRSFICITDREDETLSLGRVNGSRFKAMIRKELDGRKIQKLGGNDRDRLDYQSYGILLNLQRLWRNIKSLRRNHFRYDGIKSLQEDEDNLKISAKFQNLKAMLREFLVLILNVQ
ncbi:hypothetical protein Tco_0300665 [Tanacetum coccineum]